MRLDLTNKGNSEMWNLAVIVGAVLILAISLPAFSSEDEHGHEEEPEQRGDKNVVGADEFAENIDNDAFTNGMAITVLRYATQAAEELGNVTVTTDAPTEANIDDQIQVIETELRGDSAEEPGG